MKQISFQRLHAKDFKVYKDVTFDFTRFGPGCHSIRGVNRVVPRLGSNGAGKSTLWDALTFALYGKTTKKLRAGDLVPYGTEHNPAVTLDFTVDGQPYRIIRRAWPHSLVMQTGADVGNEVLRSSAQDHINQLLGMDLDMFMHCVVLAQGAPLFLDLAPRDKLALLSDVLNLTRFEMYAIAAKNKVGTIKLEDHTLQIARSTVEGQLAEVERQIDEQQAKATEFAAAQATTVERLAAEHTKANEVLDLCAAKALVTKADCDAAELEERDAYRELAQAEAQHAQGQKLRMRVGRLTIGSDCPQCGQPISKGAHQHLVEQAELLIETSDYERRRDRHTRLRTAAQDARLDYDELQHKERVAYHAAKTAEAAYKSAKLAINPFTAQGSILAQRRHHLEERAKEIDHRRSVLEQNRQRTEPWIDGFRDIRLMVLDEVLSTLSVLTTSYAEELGLPCSVQFSIERTTKAGTTISGIQMTVDATEKLEAWSGGEAQRLRLAASLALSASLLVEAGISFDLLALDEPSAHLSAEGLTELTAFLAQHAEAEGRRIFLTDQRRLNVDNTVVLTREAGNVSLQ